MKLIQVGLGQFGISWLKDVLLGYEGLEIIGLVDSDGEALEKAKEFSGLENAMLFTDFEKALDYTRPDFIINITPPAHHKKIDFLALKKGIPVLSEKPIAETYDDAIQIAAMATDMNLPVMIAENYRFFGISRKVKELLATGAIGELTSIQIDFQRNHKTDNYHMGLKHPLLLDVAIHHVDMVRYFSGVEAKTVFARSWTPPWSWYDGFSNVELFFEMEKGIKVSYRGGLSAFNNETDWVGDWRLEGKDGIIRFSKDVIKLVSRTSEAVFKIDEAVDSRKLVLDNFLASLKDGTPGETDISDNIKTFRIVQTAIDCIEKQRV